MNYVSNDPFSYFTTWSLLISYSIFIWTLLLGVPKWLFLFAACLLTTTSILGTFFLTIPNAQNDAIKRNTTVREIMLEDAMIHSGPLIIFLAFFNFLAKKTTGKMNESFIILKMVTTAFIIVIGYLGYIKFEKIYFYDYFTLVILCACIFVTSFQIYSTLI